MGRTGHSIRHLRNGEGGRGVWSRGKGLGTEPIVTVAKGHRVRSLVSVGI